MQKKTQVGGTHYLNTPFDANDLAYLLGASPGFRDIAKYISREKDNKMQDLEKALAYIEIDKTKMLIDTLRKLY